MSPDETGVPEIPSAEDALASTEDMAVAAERLVATAERAIEAGSLEASLSAIASAKTQSLDATGCAIGMANVGGDTEIKLSATPFVYTKGNASFHQSYASAFIAGNDVAVSQGASPMVVARTISFDQGGSCVAVASNVSVKRGFVGLLLAGSAEIGEDSKVLLTGRGVLILAAALLGGFGLVALAMLYSANRVSNWRPNITLPSWARRG